MNEIWPRLKESNVNTVLANVSWEAIEPKKGTFDFSKLDQVLVDARRHNLKIILLWFGAFKNGKSTYAPSWIKKDPVTFPRVILREGGGRKGVADVLSMFNSSLVDADAQAFAALMGHIRDFDSQHSTVIMVQVENEVGILGDSRDASQGADTSFDSPVPVRLRNTLLNDWNKLHPSLRRSLEAFRYNQQEHTNSSWTRTFGASRRTDELFMAYHYALYVDRVASAGKAEYPLPMFTNVWQNYADEDADKSQPTVVGGGGQPGDYPSGGGVINVLDIWQSFAPSLDFVAPDLYLNDYNAVCAKYRHRGQPLFIPEQRRDEYGARRIWSAYGSYGALCTSPFAIDSLEREDNSWINHYKLLSQVSAYVLASRNKPNHSFGFFFDEISEHHHTPSSHQVHMGDWNLSISRAPVFGQPGPGFGLIIYLGEARFLLVGEGYSVSFTSTEESAVFTGLLSFIEKVCNDTTGELEDGRMLNGDETRSGECAIMPNRSPDLGTFPICITIPARTGIAECEVYVLHAGPGTMAL